MKLSIPSDVVVGQYLQLIALTIAAAVAFIYTCGYTFGVFVHTLNNNLTDFIQLERDAKVSYMKCLVYDLYSTITEVK